MSRKRLLLSAALYALLAALFAMPFVRGHRCARAGGTFDRIALTCADARLTPPPAAPASPRG